MAAQRKLVAVQLPPGPAFLDAWERVWSDGDALLPLRPGLSRAARDALLAALRPHELRDADGVRTVRDPAPLDERTDLVVATSGSTGRPKGVELSRAAVEANARAGLDRLGADGVPWLCVLPLDHLAGLQVVLRARLGGGELRLREGFEVADAAAGAGAVIALVPTMLRRLLDAGTDLSAFHTILLGGAPAASGLLTAAAAAGGRVVTTYGMTETAGGCVYDGIPLDRVALRLEPDGRIALAGPMLFHGYRLDPEATAAALRGGWFTTADLGELDAAGRLTVLGRVDDMILSGGENVPAGTVAALLEEHPAVAEAAVVGVPDAEWGERAVAVVVPALGRPAPDLGSLQAHVRERGPAHHAPRELVLTARLPRTTLGKVDLPRLRAMLG
jgi:O-succinylbenzoic acid--CoA ligase